MNGTFKVVYNKARGALMVVNEITSCVQVKGTKTVIAAAVVAMMAGASGGAYAVDPIAKVDDTTFTSIKDALNSGVDGKTITLLGDVMNERGYTLGNATEDDFRTTAKNVTIDLANHSYIVTGAGAGSTGTQNQVFQLLKDAENVTFMNGTVRANNSDLWMVVQNYSNLTLDNVVVDGVNLSQNIKVNKKWHIPYAVSNNAGNVIIKNSNILARQDAIALGVSYLNDYSKGVSVEVLNTTIAGQIRVETETNNLNKRHSLVIDGGKLIAYGTSSASSGKIYNQGYTTVRRTELSDNKAKYGAAIYNYGTTKYAGSLLVENVKFERNVATSRGGAIYTTGGAVTLNGSSTFSGNSAKSGGAIGSSKGDVILNGDVTFSNNVANSGGAIYIAEGGLIEINGGAKFLNNDGCAIFAAGTKSRVKLNPSAGKEIVFEGNTDSVSSSEHKASDLYISSNKNTNFSGDGSITFGGSLGGTKDSKVLSEVANVSIADASRFHGEFELRSGEAKIGRYFCYVDTDSSFVKADVKVTGGTLDVQNVKLEDDTLSKTTLQSGALKAKVSQFLSGDLGKDGLGTDVGELNLHGLTVTGGSLILAANGLYNLDYLSSARSLLKDKDISVQLVMLGELVTPKQDTTTKVEDLGAVGDTVLSKVTGDTSGNNLVIGDTTVDPQDPDAIHREESLGVSALDVGKASKVTVKGDKTLTLVGAGADKELVVSENSATITLTKGNLVVGGDENGTKGGKLSAAVDIGAASNMTVKGNADFELSSIKLSDATSKAEIKEKASVEIGTADVAAGTLTVADASASLKDVTLGISGNLEVNSLATATVEKVTGVGAISIGDAASAGHLTLHDAFGHSGLIFIDPAWADDESLNKIDNASSLEIFTKTSSTIASQIIVGTNSIVALGGSTAEAVDAFNALSKAQGISWREAGSALYIGSPVTVTGGIFVNEGAARTDPVEANTVKVDKGMLLVNRAGVGATPAINGKVEFTANSTLGLTNVTNGEFTLASDGFIFADGAKVITDNPFMKGELTDAATGAVTVSVEAENGVGALASAGIQSMTRRADFMLSQSIADRTSIDQQFGQGLNLWVDVAGERYKADSLGNGGSFRADAGYSAFGADFAVMPGIAVGAAFQYGTASLRSDVSRIKNDIDNYGFTAYGSMAFGDAKIVADLAYVMSENDITSSQTALNQTVDADMFSLGVAAQYKLSAGSFQFVPSVGIRVSRLETDAMQVGAVSIDKQKQTLVQMPVALRILGSEMNAGSWKVAPSFKIAYVPTFGDKDIDVLGVHEDVIDDSPVQGEFGLRATNGNFMFNANMMMGCGNDDTSSIGGKVGVTYVF